jgi:hypothetical protein
MAEDMLKRDLSDPQYWRDQADKVRATMKETTDQDMRLLMSRIALGYEMLAYYAERGSVGPDGAIDGLPRNKVS